MRSLPKITEIFNLFEKKIICKIFTEKYFHQIINLMFYVVLCRDRLVNCTTFKNKGFCELIPSHMDVLCKLTCEFCGKH